VANVNGRFLLRTMSVCIGAGRWAGVIDGDRWFSLAWLAWDPKTARLRTTQARECGLPVENGKRNVMIEV